MYATAINIVDISHKFDSLIARERGSSDAQVGLTTRLKITGVKITCSTGHTRVSNSIE